MGLRLVPKGDGREGDVSLAQGASGVGPLITVGGKTSRTGGDGVFRTKEATVPEFSGALEMVVKNGDSGVPGGLSLLSVRLGFGSGHDLRVHGLEPELGSALTTWILLGILSPFLSAPPSLPPSLFLSLSPSQNEWTNLTNKKQSRDSGLTSGKLLDCPGPLSLHS